MTGMRHMQTIKGLSAGEARYMEAYDAIRKVSPTDKEEVGVRAQNLRAAYDNLREEIKTAMYGSEPLTKAQEARVETVTAAMASQLENLWSSESQGNATRIGRFNTAYGLKEAITFAGPVPASEARFTTPTPTDSSGNKKEEVKPVDADEPGIIPRNNEQQAKDSPQTRNSKETLNKANPYGDYTES